ncbi:uncharacterized protein RSE6_00877 [Rhynchosporium secalis]|uniref:Uncharacterized protein n=1 Tax=Rhynchosporium secalis TaxID=38038 RepID=A0A1E1LWD0_RHYSE|nr:uncharacterized protein RSE6_00877 [Rhynchosporium secalis]
MTYKPAVDHDIGLLIDSTLASNSYKSWPEVLKAEARIDLIEKSDGMFQYIACQFEALRRLKPPVKIRKALKELPKGLDAIQVAEIFILDPEAEVPFNDENRLLAPSVTLEILSGLVTQTTGDTGGRTYLGSDAMEIRVAHFSLKEYPISSRIISSHSSTFRIAESTAHFQITESCIAYHLHLIKTILAPEETVRYYRLWEYVVRYWLKHFDLITETACTPTVKDGALRTLTMGSQNLLNLALIRSPILVQLLLDKGADVNTQGGEHGNSLQAAARLAIVDIIQPLLDKGADVNAQGGRYGNALQAAVALRCWDVINLLLTKGARFDPPGQEWDELLAGMVHFWNMDWANQLRAFQKDPTIEGLARMREECERHRISNRRPKGIKKRLKTDYLSTKHRGRG